MKKLLFILLCVLAFPAKASHIVGGEFELIHLPGPNFSYQVNLIIYFDLNNGLPDARDQTIRATIFRKRDNAFMQSVFFSGFVETPVFYTQPSCSKGEIRTSKLTYTTTINLSPAFYNDPEGYYLIWERCCRNYTITNIVSEDPNSGGQGAGQTFYLEFPPVIKNGVPFINSSPNLFPPLTDYACPLRKYYVDFRGTDDDGDSLSYSLVTPLSTHSSESLPDPAPAPYPLVEWRPPFSDANILNGKPDLKISSDGFLTATPPGLGLGLYVFAVKCEEFRNGVKIGEVRRDFQMLVVDRCPVDEPPHVLGKKLTDAGFTNDGTMSITFSRKTSDADRCIQIQISDPDSSDPTQNFEENISIKAIPLGFKGDVSGILPSITNATLTNGSTEIFNICFDKCPFIEGPFQVGIVAYDDACSLPMSDTLKVTVNIELPIDHPPHFTTPDVTETLLEDQIRTWPVTAIDVDNDPLTVTIVRDGFNFEDFGMSMNVSQDANGLYNANLTWNTHCLGYDFSKRQDFKIKVMISSQDSCNFAHYDTMNIKLNVMRLGGDPIIDSDLTPDPQERTVNVTKKIFESLDFNVTGTETISRYLVLGGAGEVFTLSDYSMSFPGARGNQIVSSPFKWDITCDDVNLSAKDTFDIQFIVVDDMSNCRIYKADTLDVIVRVEPADNTKPTLTINSLDNTVPFNNNSISILMGQQITLGLYGNDIDVAPSDKLKIELIDAEGNVEPKGYEFTSLDRTANFSWHPDCTIFENGVFENNYTFTFRVTDDRCNNIKGDTSEVNVTIRDLDPDTKEFIPPNWITPNGDGKNDFFAMVAEDPITKEMVNILPKDNCVGRFLGVHIYNRWGKEVFISSDRDFKWFAENAGVGVYFYSLFYSDKEYKGTITVRL